MKAKIFIVEDERHLADGLKLNFELEGYDCKIVYDGEQAQEQWKEYAPDLIILDLMLPKVDGLSVAKHIRKEDKRIPIVVLTAQNTQKEKNQLLSLSVDDYLTKPFDLLEVLLRVERLLLKERWLGKVSKTLNFGGNAVDLERFKAKTWQNEDVTLTEQEAKIIECFWRNAQRPLRREQIQNEALDYNARMTSRTVDNFIVRFRKYFEKNPKKPKHFVSVRGVGYCFYK